ncbi:HNH endonuclease [Clostridium sp. HBUAS56010]|uniref:HNH endonuclease n=1 Tax=Clostridium sp. HBUAS56010 TaxID=2571127 RepID=UPI001FAA3CD9|nr:HNH endonuclease [Clostridium sp. HBUAS56010]
MDYKSKRWLAKRDKILRRDKFTCQYYKRYGKRKDATMVHHIYPVEQYPEFMWCDWNLISLSNKAHEKLHDRKTGKLTEEGENLKRKTIPPPKLK